MQDLYGIQLRKAVHKPVEGIYFLSDSFDVASWFLHQNFEYPEVDKTLVRISPTWETTKVAPAEAADLGEVSPEFRVSRISIFGKVGKFSLTGGTTYYNWFTPLVNVEFGGVIPDEFKNEVTAEKVVPLNLWQNHHIFQGYTTLTS